MISVVIPTAGERNIAKTIRLIRYRAMDPVEIVIVDADGFALRRITHPEVIKVAALRSGRAFQMNQGALLASGSVLVFLHADTELPRHWDLSVKRVLQSAEYGFFNRRFDVGHAALALNAFCTNVRARFLGTVLGDQTLFLKKKVFEHVGGFPEQMLFEDVSISRRLQRYRRGYVADAVVSSARRFIRKGVLRQLLLNQYLWILYLWGVDVRRLYSLYTGRSLDALCMLAKYPSAGKVKTRLARDVGVQRALRVYRRCLEMLVREHGRSDFIWGYSPRGKKKALLKLYPHLQYVAQAAGDLGKRMRTLVVELLKTHSKVVLIGADLPTLSRKRVGRAFSLLDSCDVVLGPCTDGGYYLIALRENHDVFSGVPWSSESTLKATLKKIKRLNLTYTLLPTETDIDTVEDLQLFEKRLKV